MVRARGRRRRTARIDLETLAERAAETLGAQRHRARARRTHRPLFFDPYAQNRATGAFILVDSLTNNTVAAGMIIGTDASVAAQPGERRLQTQVSPAERRERLGQSGAVVVLSGGVAPAELTELAYAVERALFDVRRVAMVVTAGGSAPTVARELARAGLVAVVAGPDLRLPRGKDEEPVLEVTVFGKGPEAGGAGTADGLSVSLAGAGTEAAALRIVASLLENEKSG